MDEFRSQSTPGSDRHPCMDLHALLNTTYSDSRASQVVARKAFSLRLQFVQSSRPGLFQATPGESSKIACVLIACRLVRRGGMIFTFYKARGMSVGSSLVEEDKLDLAKSLEAAAKEKGVEFILPTDVIIADKFDAEANTQTVSADAIPDGWMVRRRPLLFARTVDPSLQGLTRFLSDAGNLKGD